MRFSTEKFGYNKREVDEYLKKFGFVRQRKGQLVMKMAKRTDLKKIFEYVFIMALCLFASSYFKTLAARYLSAVLLYPLNQGCALILSSIMSVALFKETLTLKAVIGMITAFAGLLINAGIPSF